MQGDILICNYKMYNRRQSQQAQGQQQESEKVDESSAILLSKFNTVYRHNLLDILTHYADIPTDPNPDNNLIVSETNNQQQQQATLSAPESKSSTNIYNIKLKSIDFNDLTISFKVPLLGDVEMLKPIPYPLEFNDNNKITSWTQVQNVIIQMSKEAANSRKLSNLRISGISYPSSLFNILLVFLVMLLPFGYFYPHLLYDHFFANYLTKLHFLQPFHNRIFYAAFVCHFIEFWIFMVPRFNRFRVPKDYAIEWWVLTMLDGYESVKRFDSYIEMIKPDSVYYDFTDTDYMDY